MLTWIAQQPDGSIEQYMSEHDDVSALGPHRPLGVRHAPTPRQGNLAVEEWDWAAGAWVEVAALVERKLLAMVDAERFQLYAMIAPPAQLEGEYGIKLIEAHTGGGPYLAAEAAAKGCSLDDVIAGVLAASGDLKPRIAAAATAVKAAIRAATTVAGKRAAFDARMWPEAV